MSERVRHLPATVDIESGPTGVLMTTTEIIVHEESFVDASHAREKTKGRGTRVGLKALGAGVLGVVSAVFGGVSILTLVDKDLKSNDIPAQQRDIEGIALGAGGAYASYRYGKRKFYEQGIGYNQQEYAKDLLAQSKKS